MRRIWLVGLAVLVVLFMLDVMVAPSWINFHNEGRKEVLWNWGYDGNAWRLNGQPYWERNGFLAVDVLFPVTQEKLDAFGRGLVFYFKTLNSKYENVTYYYNYEETRHGNTGDIQFYLWIEWTYNAFVCDAWHLSFVVTLNIAVTCLLLISVFAPQKGKIDEGMKQ
jgi:hypothetical protein